MEEILKTLREAVLAKLGSAKAALDAMARQGVGEITDIEWHKGYVKALEEMLDLERITLRRHPRSLTVISTDIVGQQRGQGTIMNLSPGGCALTTATPLTAGEIVELACTLPQQNTPVTLAGRVVLAQRQGNQSQVGIEFGPLSEATLNALRAFLTPVPCP